MDLADRAEKRSRCPLGSIFNPNRLQLRYGRGYRHIKRTLANFWMEITESRTPGLESFLGLFNSLQQSSDSHVSSLRFASLSIRRKCGFNVRQTLLNWTLFHRAQ